MCAARKVEGKLAPAKKAASPIQTPRAMVDEQLKRYRGMRDFELTSEPSGAATSPKGKKSATEAAFPFVIQKHAASHLHYDFRLGWNGVLKSWAVAKGPSLYPSDKRLAVQVEDHPMEYGGFEGIIPQGQYGGGTVMVWDQGTWVPHGDMNEGLKNGSLKFELKGKKLRGNWTLVRMKHLSGNKPNWLLIKEHDAYECGEHDTPITEKQPDSALTGRTMDEIAEAHTHTWESTKTRKKERAWHHSESKEARIRVSDVSSLPREKMPKFVSPQLAKQADRAPEGDSWIYELKLDGYRIEARKTDNTVQLLTRSGLDWSKRMPVIADAVRKLPAQDVLLDGEVVVLDAAGVSSFAMLQAAFEGEKTSPLHYFVFDLLHLDGANTRQLPLKERKQLLKTVVADSDDVLQYSEDLSGDGENIFANACQLHAEGILCKRADKPYTSERSSAWLKLKCVHEQELVIGGFTLPSNGVRGVGALLLGYYRNGKLQYAGRTGTGFTQHTHAILRDKLDMLTQKRMPFDSVPRDAQRGVRWVKPQLVAEIRFATWTAANLVRHAAFQGLREDKKAEDVVLEEAAMKTATVADVPAIRLTHPEKVLDEASGLTKQQLADYYNFIAPYLLPYITGRPVSLVRCPDGDGKECFFQKHTNKMLPATVGSVPVADKRGKVESYITIGTAEALASLAQASVMEIHPWGSRNDLLEKPDQIIFDVDPDASIAWAKLVESAKDFRAALRSLGLESFVKTTGGKGLHVVVPLAAQYEWPVVKEWARTFALLMEEAHPELYVTKMSKAARKSKIFIDYLRNERGATAVAPYSPRAREGVYVSMPLKWNALKNDVDLRRKFSVSNVAGWKSRLGSDAWKGFTALRQELPGLQKRSRSSAA